MAEDKSAEVRQHTVIDLCQDFGNNTTMHGLRRVVNSSSSWKRGIWSLMVMVSVGWAIFQLHDIVQNYYKYPVKTVMELEHYAKMRFPAVTICNLNIMHSARTPEYLKGIIDSLTMVGHKESFAVKGALRRTLSKEIVDAASHNMTDMLITCEFDQKECSIDDFEELDNGHYGKCYTFSSKHEDLMYTTRTGPINGLVLELDIQHRHYLSTSKKVGAKVIVHDHDEVPFPEDRGVLVGPGLATSIALSQTITHRLPSPYGKCIRQKEARMRELSIFPSGKYRYTDIACRKSCFQNALISRCQCCDPLLPCEDDLFFKISKSTPSENSTQRFCNISLDVKCVYEVEFMFYNGSFDCAKYCPFECEAVIFNTAISTAAWPSDQYLQAIAKKVSQTILKNTTFEAIDNITQFVQKNFLRVEVFFQTLDVQEIITKPVYDWAMVCADVGGQLGLWLGFSILTGMELVELIVDAVRLIVRKLYVKDLGMKRPARSDIHNKC